VSEPSCTAGVKRNACGGLDGKTEGKVQLGRPKHRWRILKLILNK